MSLALPTWLQARVAVVGLGLMGGSLALALRGHCQGLWGVDINPAVQDYACQHGIVDDARDLAGAFEADLLVLAAPARAILAHLDQMAGWPAPIGRPMCLDLGSTKTEIAAAMRRLPPAYAPVGGHPMCGKEVGGLAHAEAGLFRDKVFVLTPSDRTPAWALSRARELIGGRRRAAIESGARAPRPAGGRRQPSALPGRDRPGARGRKPGRRPDLARWRPPAFATRRAWPPAT